MKPIAVPLSSINPSLRVSFNEESPSIAGKAALRQLTWAELGTEWLLPFFEETGLVSPDAAKLRFFVTLRKEGGMVRACAEVAMRPQLECVRSLTLFCEEITTRQEAFFREDDKPTHPHGEHEMSEDEFSTYPIEGSHIVLDPFLLDVLSTALPLNPLCRPDCKGLCGVCGEVLNERTRCARQDGAIATSARGEPPMVCPHFTQEA